MISNITGANDASPQNYMGLTLDWKLTGATTTGALALVEAHGSPGTEPPLHYHEAADEFFYVIEGDMTFKVGEEIKRIGGSGSVWIPRKTVHGFIIHSASSKFLFGFSPAGLEQMFMEISTPLGPDAGGPPAAPEPPPNGNTADAHRARHRTIVVGPPLRTVLAMQD
jgi:quercetin dioxygenase-like cupin family protein